MRRGVATCGSLLLYSIYSYNYSSVLLLVPSAQLYIAAFIIALASDFIPNIFLCSTVLQHKDSNSHLKYLFIDFKLFYTNNFSLRFLVSENFCNALIVSSSSLHTGHLPFVSFIFCCCCEPSFQLLLSVVFSFCTLYCDRLVS